MFSGLIARTAKRSLKRCRNSGRKTLPSSMLQTPTSRSSLTSRSCRVRFTLYTRPFAWLEFAQMISMFSSASARPNCVIPEPPFASGLFTRKTVCLSE